MKKQIKSKGQLLNNLLFLSTVFMTLFLAFIDEGYYSFNWIYDSGSWGALMIFGGIIWGIQFLIFKLILGKFPQLGIIISSLSVIVIIGMMIKLGA